MTKNGGGDIKSLSVVAVKEMLWKYNFEEFFRKRQVIEAIN